MVKEKAKEKVEEKVEEKAKEKVLSVPEVARLLSCSPSAVYHIMGSYGIAPLGENRNAAGAFYLAGALDKMFEENKKLIRQQGV